MTNYDSLPNVKKRIDARKKADEAPAISAANVPFERERLRLHSSDIVLVLVVLAIFFFVSGFVVRDMIGGL